MSKKVIAVCLALIMTFSIMAVPVAAAGPAIPDSIQNAFNMIIDRLLNFLLTYFNKYWPGYDGPWQTDENYTPENFYKGDVEFDRTLDPDAKWNLGYASASLLDGINPMNGKFFMGGSLEPVVGRTPSKILDDQRVRVFAISDGKGGTVVQAVIDGFGFARGDVQVIRERFESFAKEHNVVSVNVSVLHQHSCIDTLGMNVPLVQALLGNAGNAATEGELESLKQQKNPEFMENLYTKTVFAMKKAVMTMKPGELYYGQADIGDFIRDKRAPISFDRNITRLRFVPDDGTQETWLLEAGFHCMSFGAGGDVLTSDFPYYIEKTLREELGVNMVYIQGAELAITLRNVGLCKCGEIPVITETADGYEISCPDGCCTVTGATYDEAVDAWREINTKDITREQAVRDFGYIIAKKVMAIDSATEEKVDPILNIALREVAVDAENQILTLAVREDLINSVVIKSKDKDGNTKYKMVTEIGYMELGSDIAVFLCPGEFDPMLIYGGPASGDAAWSGEEWTVPPLKDVTSCSKIMVCGLCNDQAGYVMRDNEYHSMISENEEINSLGKNAGSTFMNQYIDLLGEIEAAS